MLETGWFALKRWAGASTASLILFLSFFFFNKWPPSTCWHLERLFTWQRLTGIHQLSRGCLTPSCFTSVFGPDTSVNIWSPGHCTALHDFVCIPDGKVEAVEDVNLSPDIAAFYHQLYVGTVSWHTDLVAAADGVVKQMLIMMAQFFHVSVETIADSPACTIVLPQPSTAKSI